MCSVNFFSCWETNHLILLQTISSFKIVLDSLQIEPIMVKPNPVGAWFLTWWHDGDHAWIDSVCWKCKKATVGFSAKDGELLDFFSIASSTSPVCKTKVGTHKEFSWMLLYSMIFKNNCLLFIIYYVHLGVIIQNLLLWYPCMSCLVTAGILVKTVLYIVIMTLAYVSWCYLLMITSIKFILPVIFYKFLIGEDV